MRVDFGGLTVNVDGLREVRGNGTALQNNNTSYGGVSAAWNGVTASGDAGWNLYGLARSQVFESDFSSVAADRNSERQVLLQRVPATDFGAGATARRHGCGDGSVIQSMPACCRTQRTASS